MKKTYAVFVFCLLFALPNFYPQSVGMAQGDKQKGNEILNALITEKKLTDEGKKGIQEVKDNANNLNPKVKIIYRNRTKIVQHKPKEIIIYVRHKDSSITEHKVKVDGGFYIVNEADIAPTKDEVKVEIKDDTIKKTNFWKRIWNK